MTKYRCALLLTGICLLLGSFFVWRALLPNNKFHPGRALVVIHGDDRDYFLPQPFHDYDDMVTILTTNRFVRDGFWRTHGLPNRAGVPATSFHDFQHDQCLQLNQGPVSYYRHRGLWMPMNSLNGDCIYTHYPPGSDWLFTLLARAGLSEIWQYKLIAILLNLGLLVATYIWLSRAAGRTAALTTAALIGSSPAFINWADALLYHPFHYLFLISGLLSWGWWLRTTRLRALWLTWLLYFAECMVSYELTLFFGAVVVGMTLIEHGLAAWRRFWKVWFLQATAPILALAIQISMSVSLFGLTRAMQNLHATAADRMMRGTSSGLFQLLREADAETMPWALIALALVTSAIVRRKRELPISGRLMTGALLLFGGMSFSLVMPGTASYHFAMMHRHYWPFMAFAMAATLETSIQAWSKRERENKTRPRLSHKWLAVASVPLLLPAYTMWRNFSNLAQEVRGNLTNNHHYEANNLARIALDTLYWRDTNQGALPASFLPVTGVRANEPRRWLIDLRIQAGAPSHYEVWWLQQQRVRRVRLLVDESRTDQFTKQCFLSRYEEDGFLSLAGAVSIRKAAFLSEAGETRRQVHYAWLDIEIPETVQTRAIRLTCNATEDLALHQWEAYSQ